MIEEKIEELGLKLPEAPKPLAAYVPAVTNANLIHTAGQLAMQEGELKYKGKVGADVTEDDAKKAAEIALLNALAILKNEADGLDNIDRIVKLNVFVNCTDDFGNQPEIANGASELLVKIFSEKGKHARAAVGVNALPRNACVELELIAALRV